MKKSDVKIGMKVVPFRKTVANWRPLKESAEWADGKKNGYLYVVRREEELNCWVLSARPGKNNRHKSGDFFLSRDFKPYNG